MLNKMAKQVLSHFSTFAFSLSHFSSFTFSLFTFSLFHFLFLTFTMVSLTMPYAEQVLHPPYLSLIHLK